MGTPQKNNTIIYDRKRRLSRIIGATRRTLNGILVRNSFRKEATEAQFYWAEFDNKKGSASIYQTYITINLRFVIAIA